MCHNLLHDPKFFQLLLQVDNELAAHTYAAHCSCGGAFHRGNYPRKPRACPKEVLPAYQVRFSFCCSVCRKRKTPMSVRFLGRRVYVALTVVLMSQRSRPSARESHLSVKLNIPIRTIRRWQTWWVHSFPMTPLWQTDCARFMPPVITDDLPASLIVRFMGSAAESMLRMLNFLTPLTVGT